MFFWKPNLRGLSERSALLGKDEMNRYQIYEAREEAPQNEPEQEEKHSDEISNAEEKNEEHAEKGTIASAETAGEEPKEAQDQPEVAQSGTDINITEAESKDIEGELKTEKAADEETTPAPMSTNEANIVAEETEHKVTEKEGKVEEEVRKDGDEGKVEEAAGKDEDEGKGETEVERKGEFEHERGEAGVEHERGVAEAEVEGEGEAEAEVEGEGEAEAEVEGEGEAEAEVEGEGEAEVEGEGEAEDEVEGEVAFEGEGVAKLQDDDFVVRWSQVQAEGEAYGEGDFREGQADITGVARKLVKATSKDKRGVSVSHAILAEETPRPSIDADHLIFDPTFTTSRMSEYTHRVQLMERDEFSETLEQEEESKVTTPSEETIPEEEEEPPLDRQPYLELYTNLIKQRPLLKMKNNFLQRKMAEYFKSRKMEHVLRESDRIGDAEAKYLKKLDALWELRNVNNMQREGITQELNEMRDTRNNQLASVSMNFEQMLSREHDIGTGLIYTKTAKEIPEKFLERLLKNQRLKSKEIEEMRLAYIRIRDAVNEIQAKIKAMDKIGEHYTLIDYEQLKMENQSHADKIEERDAELEKLREKYSAATQCLAHFREKSTNTNIEIEQLNEKFQDVEIERNNWRERVNALKHERDALRSEILKLKETSGLLAKPKLLLDLQDTLSMVVESERELDEMKEQFEKNMVVLDALKKNVEEEKERVHRRKVNLKERKKLAKQKSRLAYPSLERFNITEFEERLNNNK